LNLSKVTKLSSCQTHNFHVSRLLRKEIEDNNVEDSNFKNNKNLIEDEELLNSIIM